jgi:hypothetical protein
MIAVVIVLWLVVLTLGIYAVTSDKNSGDLPDALPADAEFVMLVGNNYSICVPNPGDGNIGLDGSGDISTGYPNGGSTTPPKTYIVSAGPFDDSGCTDVEFPGPELVYNSFLNAGNDSYIFVSNTHTLQQLIDHYFPESGGWYEGSNDV